MIYKDCSPINALTAFYADRYVDWSLINDWESYSTAYVYLLLEMSLH